MTTVGVLYDPERRWAPQCLFTQADDAIVFAGGCQVNRIPARATVALWAQAKAVCARCPVIEECRRDTLGEEYGVWGGLDEHERYLIRKQLHAKVRKWPTELRLAWGKELHRLRKAGFDGEEILRRTGFPRGVGSDLIREWEERQGRQPAEAAVVDLPLPGAGLAPRAFPDRPGRRHLWVRHGRAVTDAWYRAETADGFWIHVTVDIGHVQVNKWIEARDVRFYRSPPRVIADYAGRDGREPAA